MYATLEFWPRGGDGREDSLSRWILAGESESVREREEEFPPSPAQPGGAGVLSLSRLPVGRFSILSHTHA